MIRKISDAQERFGRAAIALFLEHGYAQTTVPQIAAAAGLTERTFFRYFVDKSEVLFWRADQFKDDVIEAVRRTPVSAAALEVVVTALDEAGKFFDAHRLEVIARQQIVAAHPNFRERELMKLHLLAAAIADELSARGIPVASARMAAEAGLACWKVAIERWAADGGRRGFSHRLRSCVADLHAVVGDSVHQ